METSPSSEANQFSDSQEIPCILWKLKAHYRNDKCPPSDSNNAIFWHTSEFMWNLKLWHQ